MSQFQAPPREARDRLKAVGVLGLVAAGISGAYQVSGIGIPCPWRAVSGTLCPFCGTTRMGAHLISGDLAGAWAQNPFTFSITVAIAALTVVWVIEALGGPRIRVPEKYQDQRFWMIPLAVIATIFTVARNW